MEACGTTPRTIKTVEPFQIFLCALMRFAKSDIEKVFLWITIFIDRLTTAYAFNLGDICEIWIDFSWDFQIQQQIST